MIKEYEIQKAKQKQLGPGKKKGKGKRKISNLTASSSLRDDAITLTGTPHQPFQEQCLVIVI